MPPPLPPESGTSAPGPPSPARGAPPERPPLSALAVSALVVALVPCCPLTGLVGAFLGLTALRRVQRSDGRLRGARLAIAATIVGVVGSLVWMFTLERFGLAQVEAQEKAIAAEVQAFVAAAQEGRADDALAMWFTDAPSPPTRAEIVAFGAEVAERYGTIDRFALLSTARSGSFFAQEIEVAGIYRGAGDSPLGSARLRMVIGGGLTPGFRLTQVIVEDPERGDLAVGGE